jgi:TolA-binding protein
MLKVFSNQLRRLHRQISSLMEKEEQQDTESGLFNVAMYYLKNKRYSQAKYVFSRYLVYYPSGRNAVAAAKGLETAESFLGSQKNGGEFAPANHAASLVSAAPGPAAPGPAAVDSAGNSGKTDSAKSYYDAVSFITQEKYQQAYMALRKIIDAGKDAEYVAKSSFDIGRCFFLMGKFDDCIKHFTQMIPKYPKHPDLGHALYFMGQSYEKLNRKDQAMVFYKQIITIVPDEDEDVNAKAKRALKGLEV